MVLRNGWATPVMKQRYSDITSRIAESPAWWDEYGVPRYGAFTPYARADIYADECALLMISCQECGKEYRVAVTRRDYAMAAQIRERTLHYGDPPRACSDPCLAGASMGSISRRVLEYWKMSFDLGDRDTYGTWVRDQSLEIEILPDWGKI